MARVAGFGPGARDRLSERAVAVVGCGALGAAAAAVLARSGVGRLRLIDRDVVEPANLGDQCLFDEEDASERRPKAEAAAVRLATFDRCLDVEPVVDDFAAANAEALVEGVDAIVDAADNLETKYLINDVSIATGVPWVYGGCAGTAATVMTVVPGETHCLRCVWPDPPARVDGCASAGLMPATAQIAGAAQATEVLKLLLGRRGAIHSGPIVIDAWTARTRRLPVKPFDREQRSACPACGHGDLRHLRSAPRPAPSVLCGGDAVLIREGAAGLDWERVRARLAERGPLVEGNGYVRFAADGMGVLLFRSGRALVHGTGDPVRARALLGRQVAP